MSVPVRDDKDIPIPTPNIKNRTVLAGSYVDWGYSLFCELVWNSREVRLGIRNKRERDEPLTGHSGPLYPRVH